MRIRGWLTGLIVFLLAPSLLFASLWFHNKFEKVNSIDHSLAGLHLTLRRASEELREQSVRVVGEAGGLG